MEFVILRNGCNSVRPTCGDVLLIAAEGCWCEECWATNCILSSYMGGSEDIWGGSFKGSEEEHGAARGVELCIVL